MKKPNKKNQRAENRIAERKQANAEKKKAKAKKEKQKAIVNAEKVKALRALNPRPKREAEDELEVVNDQIEQLESDDPVTPRDKRTKQRLLVNLRLRRAALKMEIQNL